QEAGPVSSLYLAVRAARRAVAENPNDSEAYFLLGQLYFHLAWRTPDLGREQPFPHLALLRQAQAPAALQQALLRNPDHENAHGLLSELAQRGAYLPPPGPRPAGVLLLRRNRELELRHRREAVRCARKNASATARGLAQADKEVEAAADEVAR